MQEGPTCKGGSGVGPFRFDVDHGVGVNSLAHTVFEDFELIDTGVLDVGGNKIMARQKMDQIGFVRSKA